MEVQERNEKLEETLVYIHKVWSNSYLRLIIERALVGKFDFLEDKEGE